MGQARTYFIAPNFDIHPPPDGPVRLGHIVAAPDDPTLDPINHRDYIPAPGVHPASFKEGFSSTIQKLLSGNLGFWALVAGFVGLNISSGFDKSADQEITINRLETISFSPTRPYVESVLKLPEVEEYITSSKCKVPVYMVTGLKIARGASLRAGSEQSFQSTAALEMPADTARIGPEARFAQTNIRQESFEGSSDFVLAFRVQRIRFQKVGPDVHIRDVKTHTKGAKMLGDAVETSAITYQFADLEEDVITSSTIDKEAGERFEDWKCVECPSGNVDDDDVRCNALYLREA